MRIASLYSTGHSPSSVHAEHRRRGHRSSYSQPPSSLPSSYPHRHFRRHHTSRRRSLTNRRTETSRRPFATSWKDRLGFRSHPVHQHSQPLTLEEKLRVAANRVRHFERRPHSLLGPDFDSSATKDLHTQSTRTRHRHRKHFKSKISRRGRNKLRHS